MYWLLVVVFLTAQGPVAAVRQDQEHNRHAWVRFETKEACQKTFKEDLEAGDLPDSLQKAGCVTPEEWKKLQEQFKQVGIDYPKDDPGEKDRI